MGDAEALSRIARSILPQLAERIVIDWSKPLTSWSKAEMTTFAVLTWRLINEAMALDQGPDAHKSEGDLNDDIPF